MKKLIASMLLLLVASFTMAGGGDKSEYVTADGKTYFCNDIRFGLINTKLIMDDGSVMSVPTKSLEAYKHNGRLFEWKTIYCSKGKAMGEGFMECVAYRSGLKLYKYVNYNENFDLGTKFCQGDSQECCYFVFKDGEFYLKVDAKNAESVMPFFGIKVS